MKRQLNREVQKPNPAPAATVDTRPSKPRRGLLRAIALVLVTGVGAIALAAYVNPPQSTQSPEQLAAGAAYFDSIARPYRSAFNEMRLLIYRQVRVTPKNRAHLGRQIANDLMLAKSRSESEPVPPGWEYVAQQLNSAIADEILFSRHIAWIRANCGLVEMGISKANPGLYHGTDKYNFTCLYSHRAWDYLALYQQSGMHYDLALDRAREMSHYNPGTVNRPITKTGGF